MNFSNQLLIGSLTLFSVLINGCSGKTDYTAEYLPKMVGTYSSPSRTIEIKKNGTYEMRSEATTAKYRENGNSSDLIYSGVCVWNEKGQLSFDKIETTNIVMKVKSYELLNANMRDDKENPLPEDKAQSICLDGLEYRKKNLDLQPFEYIAQGVFRADLDRVANAAASNTTFTFAPLTRSSSMFGHIYRTNAVPVDVTKMVLPLFANAKVAAIENGDKISDKITFDSRKNIMKIENKICGFSATFSIQVVLAEKNSFVLYSPKDPTLERFYVQNLSEEASEACAKRLSEITVSKVLQNQGVPLNLQSQVEGEFGLAPLQYKAIYKNDEGWERSRL
ncbi:hypothetical protein [Bdellovibrio reynosensis]|uniref:Lipoprotein n=1 Tax=Bdellovibrio reynosensis TaxID=2835041 RepID=A0ABY4CB44_9BACT|nr:hypothetical protein [Bdellovibrio reynosensis]UOF02198.1 hypothetical protein MNR06_04445 [Bdellovibrio reynosensis]